MKLRREEKKGCWLSFAWSVINRQPIGESLTDLAEVNGAKKDLD